MYMCVAYMLDEQRIFFLTRFSLVNVTLFLSDFNISCHLQNIGDALVQEKCLGSSLCVGPQPLCTHRRTRAK